jgi:peptide subunit release factor 1 (eRF1)
MMATDVEVLARMLEIEEAVERERERAAIDRVSQAVSAGTQGVAGLDATLDAMAAGRVAELVVSIDRSSPGSVCASCGRLASAEGPCSACGASTDPVPDVVEAAVILALRGGSLVETVLGDGLDELEGIGALLRF